MDDTRILGVIKSTDEILVKLQGDLGDYTGGIRASVRDECALLLDEVSLNVSRAEITLTRSIAVLYQSAQYHILRAYFHASPSLWLFLVAIYNVVMVIVNTISIINKILKALTGDSLAFWLDKLSPGFLEIWSNLMNKVSEFSAALGWGVDGVLHLMNTANAGADLWGTITGKSMDSVKVNKYDRTNVLLTSFASKLKSWEKNPGYQISAWAEKASDFDYWEGVNAIRKITGSIVDFGKKAESALGSIGTITSEVLAIRNGMPEFVAKNIPSGIWDGILRVDTAINDRILPALTRIYDKLDEVNAVLEAHRKKAAELADKIAHPGDLLAEIDKLPGYARVEQYGKLDAVTSYTMKTANDAEFAAVEGNLREFALIAEALSKAQAPLPFMELEMPGRSPGIVAEPRETWFVGDF